MQWEAAGRSSSRFFNRDHGDHKEQPETEEPARLVSLPPLTGKLKRTSVQACQANVCRGFCVFRSVTGVYLSRLQKWAWGQCLSRLSRCHTLKKLTAKMDAIFSRSVVSAVAPAWFFPW